MWPGASPAWRKRQPTKPRLGNNVKPPSTSSLPLRSDSAREIFNIVDPLIFDKRQLDDEADLASEGDAAAAAQTYNNGLWTPPAATSVAPVTMSAFTATMSLAATTDADPETASSALPTATALLRPSASSLHPASHASPTPSSSSASSSSFASSSSSSAPSNTPKPEKSASGGSGSGGFKLIYLTPILVFISLLLLFSVFGRMWGRYHHASRVEAARRAKYDKRASRQAKKREMQRIKTMWGYEKTPVLPPELEAGEHDLHYTDPNAKPKADGDSSFGSSSDAGDEKEEKYPGTFKILSLALLGEGSKPEPPQTRGEGERKYDLGVQSNSWLAVKLRRYIGRDEKDFHEDGQRYTVAPTKGARRLRHALSRDRLRNHEAEYEEKTQLWASSPATTLSVSSGEMKAKEFASIDLDQQPRPASPARYASLRNHDQDDDPFMDKEGLGWRKPLPPQPKESPFRPALLNFGLRSRSKTYDPISPQPHQANLDLDTPVKHTSQPQADGAAGFLPKTFGLGISGVWKTLTNFTSTAQHEEDEESFVGHPYRPHSDILMSSDDTPYSNRECDQTTTPTKQSSQLGRVGTVLQVKPTNQPWVATHHKTMSASAWQEALLASPPNKHSHQVYRPFAHPSPSEAGTSPVRKEQSVAPRKSLLLHQAISATNNNGQVEGQSPAFTDYSDLVACYSTPSDMVKSPDAPSIRALPPSAAVATAQKEEAGEMNAREKLARAKTAKYVPHQQYALKDGVQRSKTASTTTTAASSAKLGPGLSRKGTVHHSVLKKEKPQMEVEEVAEANTSSSKTAQPYPYTLTQPLRVSKPVDSVPISIPSRASSSPSKPSSPFRPPSIGTGAQLPTSLRIASPEPIPLSHQQTSYRQSLDITYAGLSSFTHPHYPHPPHQLHTSHHSLESGQTSPPKRSKALSSRPNSESDEEQHHTARGAVQKAKNRSTALAAVDQIVFQSYHAQHNPRLS
ncbi:uncharacterized protein UTRI_04675_B [Ustilago trichophora]|uniref:Uncharacterized protein n=1 Tax=Ustilago trichophora TaxID=86804 RepID=A0A5C3EJ96_9BASI|nr:uncharacterized protein UTRI_04675_B [Ustilago trichophora]